MSLYIGVMSGTSLDGADAVLADFGSGQPEVLAFASEAFSATLRAELLALNARGDNEIERSQLAAIHLSRVYAAIVETLLSGTGLSAGEVTAIGCHGQTIRHRPDLGFTVQLNHPARLAELTGIDVVADFRSRDIAAGGEGAPLAPAFHDGVFRAPTETRAIVNIGGIANITLLAPKRAAWGFDSGPGNALLDAWINRHQGQPFDRDGAWATSGTVLPALLNTLRQEPYFAQKSPKSTGRDRFHLDWLLQHLKGNEAAEDVQATLLDLTASTVADAIQDHVQPVPTVIVCGGGARNMRLMQRLESLLPHSRVAASDTFGVPAQQVEALAFAWLAKQMMERRALDMTATTGAKHPSVLGALYPR